MGPDTPLVARGGAAPRPVGSSEPAALRLAAGAAAAAAGAVSAGRLAVDSSLWTALTLVALPAFAAHALGLPPAPLPLAVIFLAGLLVYNLDHLADARLEAGSARRWRQGIGQRCLLALVLLSALGLLALLAVAPPAVALVVLAFGGVGVLYGLPVLPRGRGRGWWRPKDLPGAKGLLVATSITVAAVGLPAAAHGDVAVPRLVPAAAFLWTFLLGNTLMCDVGDLRADRRSGVRTLPVMLGVDGTRAVVVGVQLLFVVPFMWAHASGMVALHVEMVGSSLLVVLYALVVTEHTPKRWLSLSLDGCSFVPLVAALLLHGIPT